MTQLNKLEEVGFYLSRARHLLKNNSKEDRLKAERYMNTAEAILNATERYI